MKSAPKAKGVLLDTSYSNALLGAAAESGHTTLAQEVLEETDAARHDELVNHFTDRRSTLRLRPLVLEMAAIFERVHLLGINYGLDVEVLKKKSGDLVGLVMYTGEHIENSYTPDSDIVREVKPLIIRSIVRKINSSMREINWPQFPQRTVSAMYDSLATGFAYLDDVVAFQGYLDEVMQFAQSPETSPKDPLLEPSNPEHYKFLAATLKPAVAAHKPDKVAIDALVLCLIAVLREITNTLQMMSISHGSGIPFLTRGLEMEGESPNAQQLSQTFQVCRICMAEEIHYAPAVDSLDDVLRIRDHASIVRFRELLRHCSDLLGEGDEQAILQIKNDIRKANQELKSLHKWRKVDDWFFWAQIPAMFIPVLSQVLTVASVASRAFIEKRESTATWIGIGR